MDRLAAFVYCRHVGESALGNCLQPRLMIRGARMVIPMERDVPSRWLLALLSLPARLSAQASRSYRFVGLQSAEAGVKLRRAACCRLEGTYMAAALQIE
jgi:hypothetical protein